ncbi:hypothetical protein ABGB17_27310 [Sphaerisporangium sp. B11E5]|uniref:WD40 repeat domain-containing protein n=1 Tax=Sphaerisporangium sp. B11E5 TaxID=3153563 RepID=UPI00325EBF0D
MTYELAQRLEQALDASDTRADALAQTLAGVLSEVQAIQVVIGEAIACGDAHLLEEMAAGFDELGRQMAVFAPFLGRLDVAMNQVQRTLYRQDAEHRLDRAQAQRQIALLMVMRDKLSQLSGRLSPAGPAPTLHPEAGAGWTGGCPYQGLAPFGLAETGVFYGRGLATAQLTAMVTTRRENGLIVVTGASGAGKSSLLHAGLLPALAIPGHTYPPPLPGPNDGRDGATWPQVSFTPGPRPLQELALHLAVRCGADPDVVLRELRADPVHARARARQVLTAEQIRRRQEGGLDTLSERLIMVVDQFEELFTLAWHRHAEEAKAFLAALHAITTSDSPSDWTMPDVRSGRMAGGPTASSPPGVVVVAVRGDFVDRCAAHPMLAQALQERLFVLGPMSEHELQRAITGPAAAAGLEVEDGLAEQMVRELSGHLHVPAGQAPDGAGAAGALPLLSMAMVRTWANRESGRLTRHGYDRSGGVATAVVATAEDTYASLSPEQQQLARRLILTLTAIGADGQVTRRRVPSGELETLCAPHEPGSTRQIVEVFTTARLMVTGPGSPLLMPAGPPAEHTSGVAVTAPAPSDVQQAVGTGTIEIAHDVLVTAWPRLREWLADEHTDRVVHGQIMKDATEWNQRGRDPSFLYRGIRLENATSAATRWQAEPGRYPGLSLHVPADAFLRAGNRVATRTRRRLQALFTTLAGLLVIALVTAVAAVRFGQVAARQSAQALSRGTAVHSRSVPDDPVVAARLAAAAWAIAPTGEARAAMAELLLGQPTRAIFTGLTGEVYSAAYSPDGTHLATAGEDGTVRIWDPATGKQHGAPLTGHNGEVQSVTYSPDGTHLATAGENGTVRIWNAATKEPVGAPLTGHTGNVYSAAYSPDGTHLATAGEDGTVRFWDPATGKQHGAPLTGHNGWVYSVAYSPDGTHLATAGRDRTVRIWNAASREPVGAPLTGHTGDVYSAAYSPDGTHLATAGEDGTVRIWDPATGRQRGAPLTGHNGEVRSVTYSPAGSHLASAGDDHTVRIWDTATGERLDPPLTGHTRWVHSVAYSPDGTHLATAGGDGTVRIWDAAIGRQHSAPLRGHTGWVHSVAYSPDGTRLATTADDGTVRIWDTTTAKQRGEPLTGHAGKVYSVAFSPDGTRLATAGHDRTVRMWDTATGEQLGPPLTGHTDAVTSVTFSPNGTLMATTGLDGTIRIWDATTAKQRGTPLLGHTDSVSDVAFSPDGAFLASTGHDHTVRIWDAATGAQTTKLTGHNHWVYSVAYSPDGTHLATAGRDHTVRVWEAATGEQLGPPLTGHTGEVYSVAYSPDGTYLVTAGRDHTVRIWDAATGEQLGPPLTGHTESVSDAVFSPDGTLLATTGADRTVRTWSAGMPKDLLRTVCGIASRGFTQREWKRYVPGEPYHLHCPASR